MTKSCVYLSEDGGVLFDPGQDRLLKLNVVGAEMWKRLIADETEHRVAEEIGRECGVESQSKSRGEDNFNFLLSNLFRLLYTFRFYAHHLDAS